MRDTLGETGGSNVPDSSAELWSEFLRSGSAAAASAAGAPYTSWQFGYGVEQGDRLLALVLSGSKRATTGALWAYEHEGESVPRTGDFSVVTDGSGVARCIIRTASVSIVALDEVDEKFAYDEGEGDRTLGYWREVHWTYFVRELAGMGLAAKPDMPVVCERFELVFSPGIQGAHERAHWHTAPELPEEVFAVWHKPDRTLNPAAIVATIDPDGTPHAAPFGSLRAVTPRMLRLGTWRGHNTYANLCRDGRVAVAMVAPPDKAVSIRGRARVARERMSADERYAVVEIDIEEVKNDMTPAILVESAITVSIRDERRDWFQSVLGEMEGM
jgi:uncharacterized protein YhfF